jgi:hypothetical protein
MNVNQPSPELASAAPLQQVQHARPPAASLKVLAGIMSCGLSACSFFAYGPPVVVRSPGGDPANDVGATVRCSRRGWPVALDLVGAGASLVVAGAMVATVNFLSTLSDPHNEPEAASFVPLFVPTGLYLSGAIYGGVRMSQCRRALVASARAKLRGEPLHFEGAIYQPPPSAPEPPGPPPPGPPTGVAPLPQPPR